MADSATNRCSANSSCDCSDWPTHQKATNCPSDSTNYSADCPAEPTVDDRPIYRRR